eukprot:TRINITY_DN10839_c0_g1_i1.p1 TRINITY_DN10839_c0_g1~~TRINITY_DN10839_c0_g1_i1.p1  ORF type:complete len:807 (+),score=146.55 TRINITY_DN10839_c0_g1_i1:195-2615(+)
MMDSILPFTPYHVPTAETAPLPLPQQPMSYLPPVTKLMDTLEVHLAEALAEYRRRAEEIIEEHRHTLESTDASYQLQAAAMRAENAQLRESVGLSTTSELWQNIQFDVQASRGPSKKPAEHKRSTRVQVGAVGDIDGGGAAGNPNGWARNGQGDTGMKALASPDPSRRESHSSHTIERKKRKSVWGVKSPAMEDIAAAHGSPMPGNHVSPSGGAAGAPGGSWQAFMAWVPSGSALQSPQPWTALTQEAYQSKDLVEQLPKDDSSEDSAERFRLLDLWKVTEEESARSERRRRRRSSAASASVRDDLSEPSELSKNDGLFGKEDNRDRCTIHPQSSGRVFWDITSLVMVVYDMVMIPMIAFSLPESLFLGFMNWLTRFFWTFDMAMSCTTGVVMPNGTIKMELRFICKRYLKTWFAMDAFIVGNDWGYLVLVELVGASFVARFSRVFRAARGIRLLRLARMQEILSSIQERIQSDKLNLVLNILKCAVFIIACAHVLACLWFAVGSREATNTWVEEEGYVTDGWEAQYLVSLHWALGQFTGGTAEITPQGTAERFVACGIWVFGFIVASIIVGVITSELTQMHIVGGAVARQVATLRRYLKQNSISSNLTLRMQRSAQHVLAGDLTPDLVDLLPVVPEPLRVEMHYEMYSDFFRKHPWFHEFMVVCPLVMRRISHLATSMMLLASGDVVFSEGETPSRPRMIFVFRGTFSYTTSNGGGREDAETVQEGQWLSEAALWTTWTYHGTLTANGDAKVACLDAWEFQDIVIRFKHLTSVDGDWETPHQYAERFVQFLNMCEDVSDLSTMKS